MGSIGLDRVLQYVAYGVWCVLGLLGYSLREQVVDFKTSVKEIRDEVKEIGSHHSEFLSKLSSLDAHVTGTERGIDRLSAESSERGKEVDRLGTFVGELMEIRREERRDALQRNHTPDSGVRGR